MSEHTDIVVRLRLAGGELCLEAAREIEFLRDCLTAAEISLATALGRVARDEKPDPIFRITDAAPDTPR